MALKFFLINLYINRYSLKLFFYKFNQTIFANSKISFTRKNWLLKFGFVYRLAQILEPKLLVHEILKFARVFNTCGTIVLSHAPLTCEGFRGFKEGDKGTDFVSAPQLRACEAKLESPCLPFDKFVFQSKF